MIDVEAKLRYTEFSKDVVIHVGYWVSRFNCPSVHFIFLILMHLKVYNIADVLSSPELSFNEPVDLDIAKPLHRTKCLLSVRHCFKNVK